MEKSPWLPGAKGGGGFDCKGQHETVFLGVRKLFCVLIMVGATSLSICQKSPTIHRSEFYCMSI